jgi:hypothetical protein
MSVVEIPPTAEADLQEPIPTGEIVSEAVLREEETVQTKATVSAEVTVTVEETVPVEQTLPVAETLSEDAFSVEPAEKHESAVEDDIPMPEPKSSAPPWWQEAGTPAPTAPERPWWDVL